MIDLYLRHEYLFSSAQLTLAMLGMGATITLKDFIQVFRLPGVLLLGNAMQVVHHLSYSHDSGRRTYAGIVFDAYSAHCT